MGASSRSDRPEERPSKVQVPRLKNVVLINAAERPKRRDPRFDTLSGHLNVDLFKKSYTFIKDYQKDELAQIQGEYQKEKQEDKKQRLKALLDRLKSKEVSDRIAAQKQQKKAERRKIEKELVSQGKRPFFLKKADAKKLDIIESFNELKSRNPNLDVNRLSEKRLKKQASKQKATLPFRIAPSRTEQKASL